MIPMIEMDSPEIDKRLDLHMIKEYRQSEDIPGLRLKAMEGWRQDELLSTLSPSLQQDLTHFSEEEEDKAVRNIVDFYFEPYCFQSMSLGQIYGYFMALEKRMPLFVEGEQVDGGKAIFMESLHHTCTFSVVFLALKHLIQDCGYNKVVMLHQNEELDPRLAGCRNAVQHVLGATVILSTFHENWLREVREEINDQTVVVYMGDMPPAYFEEQHTSGKTSSSLHFYNEEGEDLVLEGFSMAAKLSKLFKADHYLLDVPADDLCRLRPATNGSELFCPVTSWVYWPLIQSVFKPFEQEEAA